MGGKRRTTEEWVAEAAIQHNNKYDYSQAIFTGAHGKVIITCPTHGPFEQKALSHLAGRGCNQCGGTIRKTLDQFISECVAVHGEKYDYSQVVYVNDSTPIIVVCYEHGPFSQIPNNHIGKKSGCVECAGLKRKTTEQFIAEAIAKHGEAYDYSESVYTNALTKLTIICHAHGPFQQTPASHTWMGTGCPDCAQLGHSKIANQWLSEIELSQGIVIQRTGSGKEFTIPGTRFRADGYHAESNTIYEFYGDYWHGNPHKYESHKFNPSAQMTYGTLYERTMKREQQIRELGYNVVTMWESEYIGCR